jgi:hypothetical protein
MLLLSKINALDIWQRECEKNSKLKLPSLLKEHQRSRTSWSSDLIKCHFVAGIRATNYLVVHISVTT